MKVIAKLKAEPGLWLSEAEQPQPDYDEVLIKVHKTAICGTDLHIYQWDEWAQKVIPVPMTVGHEFIGNIVAVGEKVTELAVGDRVAGEGHITCQHCRNCRAGRRHLCRHTQGIGVNRPGAFAEYIAMPRSNVYKIPDNIKDEQAVLLDPFGNAVHAALEFDLVGEDVLITGAGPVGLMATAIARHVGARYVVTTDVNDYRLSLAKQMGATLAVNTQATKLPDVMETLGMQEGFDVGLEMSGNATAFTDMLAVLNTGSQVAFLGIPKAPFAIDWAKIIFSSIKIHGIYGRRMFETWYKGISMLQSGLDIEPVVTGEYHYTDFEQAFADMLSGQSGKVILNWQ